MNRGGVRTAEGATAPPLLGIVVVVGVVVVGVVVVVLVVVVVGVGVGVVQASES